MLTTIAAAAIIAAAGPSDDVDRPLEPEPPAASRGEPTKPDARLGEFMLEAGVHAAGASTPIAGVMYRHAISEAMSLRGAVEAGQSSQTVAGSTLTMSLTRIHGAVLTNGPLYGGGGLTMVQASAVGAMLPIGAQVTVIEAIGGLRGEVAPLAFALEGRLGLTGPSTFTAMGGGRF